MRTLSLVMCFMVVACAGRQSRMDDISMGMKKSEVIDVLGSPDMQASKNGVEYLGYTLNGRSATGTVFCTIGTLVFTLGIATYFCFEGHNDNVVQLYNGAVTGYGPINEFKENKAIKEEITIRHE